MNKLGSFFAAWVAVMVVFGLVDISWIRWVALPLYQSELGSRMSETLDIPAAILFYLFYCAGLTYWGVNPLSETVSLKTRMMRGALYGFFTYATWALTLKVVMADISWVLVVSNILWGTFLGCITTVIAVYLHRRIVFSTRKKDTL